MTAGKLDWRDGLSLALLLAVTLWFHWPLITPDLAQRRSYASGDFYDQFYAFARYEHGRLWTGQLPLWNPYAFGGHPFLADIQAAVFYPPSLLTMLISGPGPFFPSWLEVEAIAHFGLAATFTYLFVRRLMIRRFGRAYRVGAVIAALAFTFGGYLTSYPPLQLAVLETQVWLPLILLLLDIGTDQQAWLPMLGAGAAWGMALLAGHPQSAMYVFYAAVAYGAFRSWQERCPWYWCLGAHVTWAGIGVGMAAVHLVPAWEFMRLSVRASATYETLAGGFQWRELVQYVVPGTFTQWSPMYVGIYPLALAFLAACAALLHLLRHPRDRTRTAFREMSITEAGQRRQRSQDVAFWALLAVLSLLLSLGGNAFLYRVFYAVVPGFNLFRSQERAIYLTSFALALLASYGWSWLSDVTRATDHALLPFPWLRWARSVTMLAGVGGVLLLVLMWVTGYDSSLFEGEKTRLWLARSGGLALASWATIHWLPGRLSWWSLASLVLVLLDPVGVNLHTNMEPGLVSDRIYDGTWLTHSMEEDVLYRLANEWGLPGNAGCWLGVQDLYGASPLRLRAHKAMADALPHWRLWQMLDVRYVATWEHDLPGPFPAQRTAMRGPEWEKNTVYVHRLALDFPRAWVVHSVQQLGDKEVLAVMQDPAFDPFERVLLSDPVPGGFTSSQPVRPSMVRVLRYTPEEILVEADLSVPGWLVLGEWYYPGWQASVGGRAQPIYRANYGLRAIPLGAGIHQVELRYRPRSLHIGEALSLSTVLGLILVFSWRIWIFKRKQEDSELRQR